MGATDDTDAGPSHAARPPRRSRLRPAALAGAIALVVAVTLAVPALRRTPAVAPSSAPASIQHITVDPLRISLTEPELLALIDHPPDFGPLADGRRRAACLSALGYPAGTPIRGATQTTVAGNSAVLLLVDGPHPGSYIGIAVRPSCNAGDSAALTETVLRRP